MTTRGLQIGLLLALFGCGDGAQAPAQEPEPADSGGVAGVPWKDWETTPSGLQYFVVNPGNPDKRPKIGDEVTVHYTGTLPESGKIFDSARRTGQPVTFNLGLHQVIAGWDEAVALMSEGARYKFRIPWQLAYGERGKGPIPPRQDLLFDVELLKIRPGIEIAEFPPRHEDREVKLDSGLVYEVIEEGDAAKGPPVGDNVAYRIAYTLWTQDGKFIMNSVMRGPPGRPAFVVGRCGKLQVGGSPEKFLQEAATVMKPGGVYRFTVPPDLCWGENVSFPGLTADAPTVWRLELLETRELPGFVMPDLEKAVTTKTGLRYQVLKEGSGDSPGPGDTVRVNYAGWLTDGTPFDSSYERMEPLVFRAGQVIPGWQEMLQLMKPGMLVRVLIPSELAYGKQGRPASGIPPNSPLVFQVELLEVAR